MSEAIKRGVDNALKRYVDYLSNNVELVTAVESWMKTLSYLVAGRISKSHSTVIAELMYSSSSLFTLFNDYMLRKRHGLHTLQGAGARRLKIALSCLEAVEVFIEIAARRYADPNIKWILIFCVELLKTIGRFVLQLKYKSGLRYFPLINRLNRKAIHMDGVEERTDDSQSSNNQSYYTLPHSGRQIKSVNTGSWQGVASAPVSVGKTVLDKGQMVGEALHNLQPLIHLGTEACFGAESWKPWIASIITDLASLGILKQSHYRYSKNENSEMVRRKFILWMYLLRSPCYDRVTKQRLLRLLSVFQSIPGLRFIAGSIVAYLPEWQKTYFYTWNS